jgi:hypothetical protein
MYNALLSLFIFSINGPDLRFKSTRKVYVDSVPTLTLVLTVSCGGPEFLRSRSERLESTESKPEFVFANTNSGLGSTESTQMRRLRLTS